MPCYRIQELTISWLIVKIGANATEKAERERLSRVEMIRAAARELRVGVAIDETNGTVTIRGDATEEELKQAYAVKSVERNMERAGLKATHRMTTSKGSVKFRMSQKRSF